ncbi:hypothetical protein DFJ74DRAFT_684184 [Hyaloraphidium curvatum]|nr:hypothetical protein DFJ74DRAFT_684184 [Hyaloraphidium curvatum]
MSTAGRTIVVGLDDVADEHVKANPVLRAALKESARAGDRIVLLCASKSLTLPSSAAGVADIARRVELLAARVADSVQDTFGVQLKGATFVCQLQSDGNAGEALCAKAKETGASLIVVGTRGLNALKRAVLGSVSQYCAVNAPCSVLIVRN